MFWVGVCLGARLIGVGISMVVGIFVGVIWGCIEVGGSGLEVVQNLLKGLILVGLVVVGRG